jgi:hypothetical protein
MKQLKWVASHVFILLFALYLGSYVGLSRRGYDDARRYHIQGFYYFLPEDSDDWRFRNYVCVGLFYPLNLIDQWIGLGRPPGKEPLFRLSNRHESAKR